MLISCWTSIYQLISIVQLLFCLCALHVVDKQLHVELYTDFMFGYIIHTKTAGNLMI